MYHAKFNIPVTSIFSLIIPKINIKDDFLILGSQRGLLSYLQGGCQISTQEDVAASSQEKVGLSMNKNLAECHNVAPRFL
jgi:hypothetical protein